MVNSVVIYTKDIDEMADFYVRHFGFEAQVDGPMINLLPSSGGATIALHKAAKSQKMGQVLVKLSFDVRDVSQFKANAAKQGLIFGKVHEGEGYAFANAKDPSGNSVSISNKAFRKLR